MMYIRYQPIFLFFLFIFIILVAPSCGIFDNKDNDEPDMGDWRRVAFFEGVPRSNAVAFSINAKGYVGTGYDGRNRLNDFWEYDPDSNWWIRKADFPGVPRSGAVGFSINGKGYVGTGYEGNKELKDFWEYDPQTDTWREVAPFAGSARYGAVTFVINGKGYVGTGHDGNDLQNFWAYDPLANEWEQIPSLPGNKRTHATAFVVNNIAYVGTGRNSGIYEKDFWKYDPDENRWSRLNSLVDDNDAGDIPRGNAIAFSLYGKGYIALGERSGNLNDVWEYDPNSDTWKQLHNFDGASRNGAVVFTLNDYAYVGTGITGSLRLDDFYDFDPTVEYDEDT